MVLLFEEVLMFLCVVFLHYTKLTKSEISALFYFTTAMLKFNEDVYRH